MVTCSKLLAASALAALATLVAACSSGAGSVAPPLLQQTAGEQAQSLRQNTGPAPLAFGQPIAIPQTSASMQAPVLPSLAPTSKNGESISIPEPNMPAEPQVANAAAGPPVYITDINKRLWKVTTGTNAVKFIGNEGVLLTDLAIDPVNHALYGISFTSLYRVSETTGHATFVGGLGISTANAFVFDKSGTGFVAGENNYDLYSLCPCNGRMSVVGSMYPFTSAGDLTFYNGYLVLSGQQGAFNQSAQDDLILLDPQTGQPLEGATTGLRVLYGLYSPGTNQLYGFANTSLYHFTNRVSLVKNFASYGVGQIYGAAYDGAFQN